MLLFGRGVVIRRERVHACIHPETYKYFLPREEVLHTWKRLAQAYGEPTVTPGFGVMEIRTPRLLLRSTRMLNPITVIRLRKCTPADVEEFHVILQFEAAEHAA